MIGAPEGKQAGAAAHAAVAPILNCHFQRDFDGHGTRVGKEHAVELTRREDAGEPARQSQPLLVRQAGEHHVRHLRHLALDRSADVGVVVAVTGGPPCGDAVDQFAAVGKRDPAAFGRSHRKRRACGLHLRIGQPDVIDAGRVPVRRGPAYSLVFAGIARHSALSWN